jgi:hypothetical protein
MIIRLVLAFLLGYWLGGLPLLLVFCAIIVHQVVYELWAKPKGSTHPLLLLSWLSFNLPLRFLAGLVVVAGFQAALLPFIFLFVSFYFCSFGGMAVHWKMEARNYLEDIRPQGKYFQSKKGDLWQHVGLIAAILVGLPVISMPYITLPCNARLPFLSANPIHQCNALFVNLGWAWSSVLTIALIAISIAVSRALICLFKHIDVDQWITDVRNPFLFFLGIIMVLLLVILGSSLFIANVRAFDKALLLIIFVINNIYFLIFYHNLDYLKYVQSDLSADIKSAALKIYRYIFNIS